jgi:putative ABC transport system substrate-binding protein
VKRRELLIALGSSAAFAWPLAAGAQQKTTPVIGFLHSLSADRSAPVVAAFRQGLSENGFVDGQNVAIEYRWAEGQYDRLPAMAADLVGRKVDVILTGGGTAPVLAAKQATSTIPIVMGFVSNPVDSGLVDSLARPGGNVTGIGILSFDLVAKRIELLSDLHPQTRVLGLLVNPTLPTAERQIKDAQAAASIKALQIHVLKAGSESEVDTAFAALSRLHADALVVSADAFLYNQREQLAALAARYAVPAIYELRENVDAGGLISYGSSVAEAYKQAAVYVGRILKGEKPGDLPVQQPTKFELVVNLKAAKALGLTVPHSLLARADEVIE